MSDSQIIMLVGGSILFVGYIIYLFSTDSFPSSTGASVFTVKEVDDAFANITLNRKMRAGEVAVLHIIRQSGNVQRVEEHRTVESALASARTSFRRAKVDTVRIYRDTEGRATINRSWHSHRGSQEGKKFGGIDIQIIDTWTAEERAAHEAKKVANREADRAYRASLKARKQEAA